MQGIYVFEGDVLRICLNESSDGRATAFDSETDTDGYSVLAAVFEAQFAVECQGSLG